MTMMKKRDRGKVVSLLNGIGSIVVLAPSTASTTTLAQARSNAALTRCHRVSRLVSPRTSNKIRVVQLMTVAVQQDKQIDTVIAKRVIERFKTAVFAEPQPRPMKAGTFQPDFASRTVLMETKA